MEVILIENIEKLGKIGDVVKVKDGYARNYLIPKKKVLRSNNENLKVFEQKKKIIEAEEKKRKEKSLEIAKKIRNSEFMIIRNAGENGQLYGSVTSKDIIKEIKSNKNVDFLNDQINLKKPIKNIGVFEIEVSVYMEAKEKILINVAKTKTAATEQLKEFKNPKTSKKTKVKVKDIEKTKDDTKKNEEKELSTKDLLKEIEKKDNKSLSKKKDSKVLETKAPKKLKKKKKK